MRRRARGAHDREGLALFLHGRADYPFGVIGVPQHCMGLAEIAVTRGWTTQRNECIATLIVAGGKPYEKSRVAVEIGGVTVGYCPSYLATQFREWVNHWRYSHAVIYCRSIVIAERGLEHSAVRLDIELPYKVTRL